MLNARNARNGFSLVELSIVLVIIAVIVGGITTAQSLIQNYRITAAVSDLKNYKNAYDEFHKRYDAVPGDMNDAVNIWGNPQTVNGNGNSFFSTSAEGARAWQHLLLAGFFEGVGSQTGVPFGSNPLIRPGQNVPETPLGKGTGYMFSNLIMDTTLTGSLPGAPNFGRRDNVLIIGKSYQTHLTGAAITGTMASNIDIKMDDGKAGRGMLTGYIAHNSGSSLCISETSLGSGKYNYNETTQDEESNPICILVYYLSSKYHAY